MIADGRQESQNYMKPQVLSEQYKVTSYLVNLRGEAGLYSVLSFIQDVGWLHAVKLNVKLSDGLGWVFTRQKLEMSRWPKWNETVAVKTWLRPPESDKFLVRDYEIIVDSSVIGQAASTFSAFDLSTRKISSQNWSRYKEIFKADGHHSFVPQKILPEENTEELTKFRVRNSDLDLNNHVNNTKYAQWILDSIPLNVITSKTQLLGYEINYLAEAKPEDLVVVKKSKESRLQGEVSTIQFQGIREPQNHLVFCAELKTRESMR